MNRLLSLFFASLLSLASLALPAAAEPAESPAQPVPVSVFVREDCQHCQAQKAWLAEIAATRSDIEILLLDITDPAIREQFDRVTELANLPKSTPVTIVGDSVIQGFGSGDTTGVQILSLIDRAQSGQRLTVDGFIASGGTAASLAAAPACPEDGSAPCAIPENQLLVQIPFVGAVDVAPYSLPVMASILGLIDGFNPCAMWVLVTFLIVLLQLGDRRKMWQVAGLFIVAEAIMYYAILNVWFTTWDFIGLDRIVTPLVGLVAVLGGAFFLYAGITSDGACKVTNMEQRRRIHFRIRDLVARPMTLAVAGGVLLLAFSVNIIEFACSIGIPQAFTKILELNTLSWLAEQGLMALYILFYMLDDFIVFGLALWGAQHLALTQRYSKASNVIGGVLMLILGGLLIFAPQVLKFI